MTAVALPQDSAGRFVHLQAFVPFIPHNYPYTSTPSPFTAPSTALLAASPIPLTTPFNRSTSPLSAAISSSCSSIERSTSGSRCTAARAFWILIFIVEAAVIRSLGESGPDIVVVVDVELAELFATSPKAGEEVGGGEARVW